MIAWSWAAFLYARVVESITTGKCCQSKMRLECLIISSFTAFFFLISIPSQFGSISAYSKSDTFVIISTLTFWREKKKTPNSFWCLKLWFFGLFIFSFAPISNGRIFILVRRVFLPHSTAEFCLFFFSLEDTRVICLILFLPNKVSRSMAKTVLLLFLRELLTFFVHDVICCSIDERFSFIDKHSGKIESKRLFKMNRHDTHLIKLKPDQSVAVHRTNKIDIKERQSLACCCASTLHSLSQIYNRWKSNE